MHFSWTDVISSALPTVVLVGGAWLRTHGKVKEVLTLVRKMLDNVDDSTNTIGK